MLRPYRYLPQEINRKIILRQGDHIPIDQFDHTKYEYEAYVDQKYLENYGTYTCVIEIIEWKRDQELNPNYEEELEAYNAFIKEQDHIRFEDKLDQVEKERQEYLLKKYNLKIIR